MSNDVGSRTGPLAHLRVLELASLLAAPFCGRLLADFGASVVKVEDPQAGDQGRKWGPFDQNGIALSFIRTNANKQSVAIDLRTAEGRDVVRRLVPQFDVVIANFRPGRLEQWGLGYEDLRRLNPGVVLVRLSGFGDVGEYRRKPGFGTIADAFSGFSYVNGWPETPPTLAPFGLADHVSGLAAAYASLVALAQREKTGVGADVDIALFEPLMVIMGELITKYSALGEVQERVGNGQAAASPRGMYQASDGGWLSIAGSSQRIAERVFVAIGHPEFIDDERYATPQARVENDADLQVAISAWVSARMRDEAISILEKHEVAVSPVNSGKDIVDNAFLWERGSLVKTVGAVTGGLAVPGRVARIDGVAPPEYGDPPAVGQHTVEVLTRLAGLDHAAIDRLCEAGVIGAERDR